MTDYNKKESRHRPGYAGMGQDPLNIFNKC